jgi:septal ring factor EnvC (AmiA/AmiB activator)
LPSRTDFARSWRAALGALLLSCSVAITAAPDRAQELAELRGRIEKLQSELEETRGERDTVRDSVRAAERRIDARLTQLRKTRAREQAETRKLATLEKSRARAQGDLARHRGEIEATVRAAYVLGRQDPLKLLLSQDDPARVSRMLVYARYVTESRVAQMLKLQRTLAELDTLEKQIGERRALLQTAQADLLREKKELDTAQAERKQALAQLNRQVRNQSQEIERAKRDAERLTKLLRELSRVPSPLPPPALPAVGRGRWPLPVQGQLAARYGSPRPVGELRWRGIFLAAPEGRPVRAPARARVVYADWLRGFGLLLILDHGGGIMTLYGHNQNLLKALGDGVEAGETVAVSGSTGGPPWPGLYFEIRQNGEPRDPLDWCKL